ncbi:hypothetical protein [Thiohalophilus sp.]|uniref:hypothetical protein n=1 Tax=Thiohalophilus sp. TaxID=3028392 RepID=UPI002ACEC80F|nr:hypothetical protein [Thiohalophilus sp.]MDZ7804299.1 hypothetical protein [Thiohalophilus sp.]
MLNIFSNVKNSIKELNNQLSDYKSQIEAKTAWLEKLRTGPITQAEAKEKALEGAARGG